MVRAGLGGAARQTGLIPQSAGTHEGCRTRCRVTGHLWVRGGAAGRAGKVVYTLVYYFVFFFVLANVNL